MDELIQRLKEIKVDSIYGHQKHFNASERKYSINRFIGIPLLIINISIGTALFAIFDSEEKANYSYIPIVFSYVAAVLAGLQTFLGYEKQAVGHHNIALKYLEIDKEIRNYESVIGSRTSISSEELIEKLNDYTKKINKLNLEASAYRTSKKDYKRAKLSISNQSYTNDEIGL